MSTYDFLKSSDIILDYIISVIILFNSFVP